MARFLQIYLSCLILTGISGCRSDETFSTVSYYSKNQPSALNESQLGAKQFSVNNNIGSLFNDSLAEPIDTRKVLTTQATNSTSNTSINWDVDKDGVADALTDGLLILRYTFGLTGDSLLSSAVSENSTLSNAEIESEITSVMSIADIDGDGDVDALTDGLMILRYLFGLSGDPLIIGSISTTATRTSVAEISQYLLGYMPSSVDDSSTVIVSGRVTFDLLPFKPSGNGLDVTSPVILPAKRVLVEVRDYSGNVVVSGNTDDDGNFSFDIPKDLELRIRVSAKMLQTSDVSWNVEVRDNTTTIAGKNPLYVTDSSAFITSNNITKNIHLPSGRNGSNSGVRSAAPFAILDTIYDSMGEIIAVEPEVDFPPLEIYWSPQNNSSSGSLEDGDLGSSFFLRPKKIYILGDENSDADEYDRHVVAHEWIHYFEDNFSRSDSLGGPHSQDDRLDMRVAFSEGLANALSGVITNDPIYRDSNAFWPYFGWSMDIESDYTPYPGWFNEDSVQSIVYDLYDANSDGVDNISLGFEPIYSVLTSEQYINNDYFISIFPFAKILKDQQADSVDSALDSLLLAEQIFGTGYYGIGETNNGGISSSLPVYRTISANTGPIEVCYNNNAGVLNKLGNRIYSIFDVANAGTYQISLSPKSIASASLDADLVIFKSGTTLGRDYSAQYNGNAFLNISLTTGKHIIEAGVWDPDQTIALGSYCFNLEIN
jgi:hypothetical protein